MSYRCTSTRVISAQAAVLAIEIALFRPSETDVSAEAKFQCQLDDSEHRMHGAFLRDVPEDTREVYYCWEGDGETEYVMLADVCLRRANPQSEACTLFRHHQGVCDWMYVDSQRVALMAEADQYIAYYRDHGALPPKGGVEE